ncbi:MAG TPA: hypothetical protein VLZ05_23990 [Mycobacterium sp.]|nr:hypothetical protein [Mycobacterium sp.]HUH71667.1 hypothetical protein [Mycobacterium sp.]
MTGPHSETESPGTRPISVAELLARNGTIGEPSVTRRRRRRRGDSHAVTVAELTGEIPVIRDDKHHEDEQGANGAVQVAEPLRAEPAELVAAPASEDQPKTAYWSEPEPRWPKSPPQPRRVSGPERSAYPRPLRHAEHPADRTSQPEQQSGAEHMSPDPVDHYADIPVDVMDSEVGEAEPVTEDSAYVRSFLQASDSTLHLDSTLFGGQTLADEMARRRGGEQAATGADSLAAGPAGEEELDEDHLGVEADRADEAQDVHGAAGRVEALWHGSLIVLQSILAVVFGAGLFVAFDELWRWNSIVALVLSVLVILGLVVGVRVVRKTEDIASTLIAVAVGALITLGPLALSLQSG